MLLLAGALGVAVGSSASASSPAAPTSVAADTTAPEPTLTLLSMNPVVHPGDDVTVGVRVTNPTTHQLKVGTVELSVGWRRLGARSDIAAWVNGEDTHTLQRQGSQTVEHLVPGAHQDLTFTFPVDQLKLAGAGGPRQVSIELDADGTTTTVRTFLLWEPNAAGTTPTNEPIRLSVLAPVTGPAVNPASPLSTDNLAGPMSPGGSLSNIVASVGAAEHATGARGTLALAVDPALVATASRSDVAQVAAWAGEVSALSDKTDVSPLPPYDPDLGALAHAGLSPASLGAQTHAALPDSFDIPAGWSAPLAWPADGAAPDVATLGAAKAAGIDTVVVPTGLSPMRGTASGITSVTTPQGDVKAVVADGAFSQVLTSATDLSSGVTPTLSTSEAVQRLLAESSVVSAQNAGDEPHLLAVLPRGWSPDVDALGSVLSALHTSGLVEFAPLGDLLDTPAPKVARISLQDSSPQGAELDPADVRRLDAARTSLDDLASVAKDPADVIDPLAPALTSPLSVAWRSNPTGRGRAVADAVAAVASKQGAVSVSATDVTLIAAEGRLPVVVHNALPTSATVTVVLRPDNPRLVVDSRPRAVVPAGGQTRVDVPVSALGSGDVKVRVDVLTTAGVPIAQPITLQLRVRAGWETVGTAVAMGAVGLLFVLGIWRTVRRGRSPRRTVAPSLPDPLIPGEADRPRG